VRYAGDHLPGEKNGPGSGMMSDIAARNAKEEKRKLWRDDPVGRILFFMILKFLSCSFTYRSKIY
jgi:hypothetical protein